MDDRVPTPIVANGFRFVKQVIAVVKPYLAQKVLGSLERAPIEAITVTEVKGFGRQKSYLDQYGDSEYSEAFLPKVEITAWVEDARVEEILAKLVSVARSGRMGDGKIFVMPVLGFLEEPSGT
ncbi:Nitrogen regulatory protein P-II [Rosistilla carotiformis]|uniref:Nitrogen regulatory protein P-II n=1 Tax=Rosistilla carotiformis TaxID=2528017 RepID=A0A518K153_9BACT|nr:Nitrogen regulatory protein P-II [Rosistilla carotiformis]